MIRLNALNKTLFAALLTLSCSQSILAGSNLYQSDGKMPFVKMMLSMMSAMGMLDKVSGYGSPGFGGPGYGNTGYGRYGGYGPYGNSSPQWGSYSNSPFQRSPWLQSPWSPSSLSGVSPVWGSPDWGVLPTHEYSYGYSPYGYGYTPYGTRWSSADLEGWVSEPWEDSEWNPEARDSTQAQVQPRVQVEPRQQPVTPIVQNFNYNLYEEAQNGNTQGSEWQDDGVQWLNQQANNQQAINRQGVNRQSVNRQNTIRQDSGRQGQNRQGQNQQGPNQRDRGQQDQTQNRRSPLAKVQQRQSGRQAGGEPGGSSSKQLATRQKSNKRAQYEKPCITDFCGLKKPDLNGLWVAQDGEMLGVKNQRYLWSDGEKRYLTGQLKVQNEYLLASVEGSEKLMRFKYKLAGNHLLTMQPDGTIREFRRKPNNLYSSQYQGAYSDSYRGRN